jgi:hypothetical protein
MVKKALVKEEADPENTVEKFKSNPDLYETTKM